MAKKRAKLRYVIGGVVIFGVFLTLGNQVLGILGIVIGGVLGLVVGWWVEEKDLLG
jgi:hypothetical protein